MVRAFLGGLIVGCIEAHALRKANIQVSRLDMSKMTDRDVSDVLHGRALRPGCPGVIPVPRRRWWRAQR